MARRENKSTARLLSGFLYTDAGTYRVGSPEWLSWLNTNTVFYYDSPDGTFTARREMRSNGWYWYAFRRVNKKLYKSYLGRSHELTPEQLRRVAVDLDARANAYTKCGASPGQN